jgi:hypothetical protein
MNDRLESSRTPDLSEVIQTAMSLALGEMFVALPGAVQVYDPVTQTADVLPMVTPHVVFEDGNEDVDMLPVIPSVPVAFPRGGGAYITFPIVPGDLVLLVFCDRSIDKYKTGGGTVPIPPIDLRQHDISDAVAIPGFYPLPKVIKDAAPSAADAVFGVENGVHINLKKGGTAEITSGGLPASVGGYVAMANLVGTLWTTLWGVFSGWTPVANDGGAALKTAFLAAFTTAPNAASVASKNLKAD